MRKKYPDLISAIVRPRSSQADLKGKTVIHTTTAGTQGLINASGADIVITGSFVNAGAIIRFIKALNPDLVSLGCHGIQSRCFSRRGSDVR